MSRYEPVANPDGALCEFTKVDKANLWDYWFETPTDDLPVHAATGAPTRHWNLELSSNGKAKKTKRALTFLMHGVPVCALPSHSLSTAAVVPPGQTIAEDLEL